MLLYFSSYYTAIIIKTVWYWCKNKWTNEIEFRNRLTHTQTTYFNKGAKAVKWIKDTFLMGLEQLHICTQKRKT